MTLFVVLGEGEMPAKEVNHQLDDLWKQAEAKDTDFWFAMEGKATMTETDKAIVAFFNKFDIHYGLLTTPDIQPDEGFTEVAEYIEVDDVTSGALGLMQMISGEGEDVVLLSLFADDDDADRALLEQVTGVLTAGFPVLGLNDSLEPVELLTEEVKEMPEETVEAPAKERRTKPRPVAEDAPAEAEGDEGDEPTDPEPISRQYLESLTAAEVKEIAKGMGIAPTNKPENVDAILKAAGVEDDAPTAQEVNEASAAAAAANWGGVIDAATKGPQTPLAESYADEADYEEVTPEELPDDTVVAPPTMEELFQPMEHALVVIHRNSGMQTLYVPASLVDGWIKTIGGPA